MAGRNSRKPGDHSRERPALGGSKPRRLERSAGPGGLGGPRGPTCVYALTIRRSRGRARPPGERRFAEQRFGRSFQASQCPGGRARGSLDRNRAGTRHRCVGRRSPGVARGPSRFGGPLHLVRRGSSPGVSRGASLGVARRVASGCRVGGHRGSGQALTGVSRGRSPGFTGRPLPRSFAGRLSGAGEGVRAVPPGPSPV